MELTNSKPELGWRDVPRGDPSVRHLRAHLETNNGIQGLEIYKAEDVAHIVDAFDRDGFVVVSDILNSEQINVLAQGVDDVVGEILELDKANDGNRGTHRYSFGGSSLTRSQLHRPAWQMLLELDVVTEIVAAIFRSKDYILRAGSGDFCLPGAVEYQRLHSDVRDWESAKRTPYSSFHDPRGQLTIYDLPCPYLCVNFLPQDITRLNGPTRQIPGTQSSRAKIPALDIEPEWMRLSTVCPAPAGAMMIRDVRAWHGGTPNLSDRTRAIPNLEFYAPWFREPIVAGIDHIDYKKLSERAQELARYCVSDSSEPLKTGTVLYAP